MFAKLRKKNTLFEEERFANLDVPKEIAVDIFPFDNASDSGYKSVKFRANMIKIFNSAVMVKINIKKLEECNFIFYIINFYLICNING